MVDARRGAPQQRLRRAHAGGSDRAEMNVPVFSFAQDGWYRVQTCQGEVCELVRTLFSKPRFLQGL